MTRLDRVIEAVKERRKGSRAWIYDENHNISDNVICGDVLVYLESLKDYEINVNDKWLDDFLKNPSTDSYYTYNYNANISDDIAFRILKTSNGETIVAFCVHVGYDARVGFTEWFVCEFKDYESMYEVDGVVQNKWFGKDDRYCAYINIFSEIYDVWDSETERLTEHYCMEVENLLRELEELEVA